MAAVFAAVMALGGRKSARGGYDIPSGVNPVVQAHEEEMILPRNISNGLRGLIEGGGGSAAQRGPAPVPVQLSGVSAGDFFIAVRKDLVKVLNGAQRDFAFGR